MNFTQEGIQEGIIQQKYLGFEGFRWWNMGMSRTQHPFIHLESKRLCKTRCPPCHLRPAGGCWGGSGLDVEWDWIITHLRSVYGACSSWRGHRKALIKHYIWQTYTNFVYFYNSLRIYILYITPYSNTSNPPFPICSKIQVRLRTNEIEGRGCVKVFVQTMVA